MRDGSKRGAVDAVSASSDAAGTAASAPSSFRRDIQGLRAVAVLSVVFYHADKLLVGGFVGVDVFFVISGFVISGVLLRELDARGSVDLRRFYSRRVRRLLPALGVMLLLVGLASTLILSPLFPQPVALETGAWAAASSANIYLWLFGGGYFGPGDEQNPFVHTWSLGIEEQFYLVFPALVAAVWAWSVRRGVDGRTQLRRALTVVVGVSFIISIVFTYNLFSVHDSFPAGDRFAFYGPFSRAWEFGVGVLLALYMGSRRSIGPPALAWVGLALLLASFVFLDGSIAFPGFAALPSVVGTILLILNGSSAIRTGLEQRVMVWIGDRSYGWYLWHWPFVVFAKYLAPDAAYAPLVAVFASLIPTEISYRYVESRFRAASGAPTGGAVRLALVFAAVPLVLLAVGLSIPRDSWGLNNHPERNETSASNQAQCFSYATPTAKCTFEPDGPSNGTILLVGDSHAGAISWPVLEAAKAENYRVVVHTVSACPFAIDPVHVEANCVAHNRQLIDLAAELQPDVLVVANASVRYPDLWDAGLKTGTAEPDSAASAGSIEAWQGALETALQGAVPHADRLVFFSVTPVFDVVGYNRTLPSLLWPDGQSSTKEREEIQQVRLPVLDAEREVLERLDIPVVVIDPIDEFCDELCSFEDDSGRYLYRDPSHMVPLGSGRFIDDFENAFAGR